TIFVANYGSGNITVVNASTNQPVGSLSGYFPQYLAYDSGTNVLYMSSSENGQVDAYNATTYASLGPPLTIQSSIRSGGIAYTPSNGYIYVSNEFDSSISILSGVNVTSYPVTFVETGLVAGTSWGVTLGGVANASVTNQIGFVELNGTLAFAVGVVPGYVANVSSGNVVVSGGPAVVDIGFTPIQTGGNYLVTFNETGLVSGTHWDVSMTPGGSSGGAAPTSIVFDVANGSYDFTVLAVTGYSASPASGSVVVVGGPQWVTITFTPGVNALTASLAIDPSNVTLGGSATLTTTASGGTPPLAYAYSGLPSGCTTVNLASFSCTSTVAGTFPITVNVSDSAGAHALAHATLKVSSQSGPTGTSGSSTVEWVLITVVVIVALLLLLFFFIASRRKRDRAEGPKPADAVAPPPTPPGGAT
ncbi:MAG: hypothetical protein L3K02_07985, partial [Thermoplasmata archaeon]|nr:hypothetical protein [Thermoplasmata archaeon]